MGYQLNVAVVLIISIVSLLSYIHPMKVVHPGRHVCMDTRQIQAPVKQIQSYCKATYHKELRMCGVEGAFRLCTSFRVVYKTAYRQVFKSAVTSRHVYVCCPGWTQRDPRDRGCMKPVCSLRCQNGGECMDQKCQCQPGWTGVHCETDIDECSQNSVCEQTCTNTQGSFQCGCRDGFELSSDQKSCKYCLKCQPEYKDLVNDYHEVKNRLTDMEDKMKANPTSNLLVQHSGQQTIQKQMQQDIDNHIVDNLKVELTRYIDESHASLKARLLDDIFSYMKQTVQPDIQEVIMDHVQTKLYAAIKADTTDYTDEQIIANMSLCRDALQKGLSQVKIELDSYKGTLQTYSKDMILYRQEVEHYKNELKDEMNKFRGEVEHLRKEVQQASVEPTQETEYFRLVSLGEQIGLLEAQIASCNCGRQ